jgi:hypothetical protein
MRTNAQWLERRGLVGKDRACRTPRVAIMIVASHSSLITDLNLIDRMKREKLKTIQGYMNYIKMPHDFQLEVMQHIANQWVTPRTSTPGTGLAPAHICTGTALAPAHICARTGLRAHRVQSASCMPCRLPSAHHFPNQDGAVRAAPCGTVCYCALLLGVVPFHAAAERAGGSRNIHTPGYSRVLEGTLDAPSCRGIGLVAQEHGHGLNAEDFFSELTTSLKHRVRRPRGGAPKAVPGTVVGCFPYRRGQRY